MSHLQTSQNGYLHGEVLTYNFIGKPAVIYTLNIFNMTVMTVMEHEVKAEGVSKTGDERKKKGLERQRERERGCRR